MGAGSCARGDSGHLRLRGVSGAAEGDLRSAAGAVGAWSGHLAEQAGNCDRGYAASVSVRFGDGGNIGAGPGCEAAADYQRNGAGRGQLRTQGSSSGAHAHRGCLGHRYRRGLPQGKQETGRRDSGVWRSDCERAADGDVSRSAKFSSPQQDSERIERGRAGGGGGGELRDARDGALRVGAESRSFCGAGKRDQQGFMDSQHVD